MALTVNQLISRGITDTDRNLLFARPPVLGAARVRYLRGRGLNDQ
jgi:hypothetical protein